MPAAVLRREGFTTAIRDPYNNNANFANNTIPENRLASATKKMLDVHLLPNFNATLGNFCENRAAPIEAYQVVINPFLAVTSGRILTRPHPRR